jgi:hypothetical protein
VRVFIGPVEIAGYYSRLAAALRGIGVDAVAVDLSDHRFNYGQKHPTSVWVRAAVWAARGSRAARARPTLARMSWRFLQLVTRVGLLGWSLWRFDAYIFGFGETLLFGRELPLLRLLRKRIVFAFNGTDARPPYIDGADMAPSRAISIEECIDLARRKKAKLRRLERYADAIVAQPAFSHFFERPVVDFFRIGVPWRSAGAARSAERDDDEIRILHSPSDPEVKGSGQIRAVVEELRRRGRHLRLVELREVPNDVVRSEIARADFVIDQLYSDAPMVGFATEAAAAGVPAIVGGYAWPELRQMYPGEALPPVEQCHPDGLATAIERLADDAGYRQALGARARAFVETEWAPRQIAERYLAILEGRAPADWLYDPATLRYVAGVGLPERRSREIVAAVLERGGREALQVGDKPSLEEAFVDYADSR